MPSFSIEACDDLRGHGRRTTLPQLLLSGRRRKQLERNTTHLNDYTERMLSIVQTHPVPSKPNDLDTPALYPGSKVPLHASQIALEDIGGST